MRDRAEQALLNARQLLKMTPHQRREAIKRRIGPKLVERISDFRAKREARRLSGVEQRRGMEAAHDVLWSRLARKRGWISVRNRVLVLAEKNPAEIDRLVVAGLRRTDNPLLLAAMAQHPLTASAMAQAMADERLHPNPDVSARIAKKPDYAAAFLAATAFTGDDAALDHAAARLPATIDDTFLQIVESFGQRPTDAKPEPLLRGLRQNGLRTPKRHRLVIADNLEDAELYLPFLSGADKVTLLGLDDTFGKAAFDAYRDYPGVGEIIVEHVRSRITRFSQLYVDIHSQTRDAAIELAAIANSVRGLIPEGDLPHLELAIADYLFFQSLRLRAVEELLADPDFDHIVVTTNNHVAASGYILTLAGLPDLAKDPRVELVSVATGAARRSAFSVLFPAMLTGPRPMRGVEAWLPPAAHLAPELWHHASGMAEDLPDRVVPDRRRAADPTKPSVLMVATSNTAYDLSTARYAAALSQDFSTAFAICGGNAAEIQAELSGTDIASRSIPFHLLSREYLPGPTAFARWMAGQVSLFCERRGPEDKVAHLINCAPGRLVGNIIQSQILHGQVLDRWFGRMAKTGGLPDAITLSAARAPAVSQVMATARRHGVPTLLLEAHGLNSNYSRYTKVGADYYGVITEHFREDAARGFAIGPDRTRVLGTPRIIARAGRDKAEARAMMAEQLGTAFPLRPGGVISLFSQPSNWTHVAEVWRMVLAAARDLDLQVLLKPHPEETASRVGQYGAIVSQMQMQDQVLTVKSSPNLLIEASDVVLTGYSAAALDAAVMGRPVICVTVGNAAYPVDQHRIAQAPLVRDMPELREALSQRLAAPSAEAYAAFLRQEPQFVDGPDQRLRDFMAEIIARPTIRPGGDLPRHLFLDPPYPTFAV